MSVSKIRSKVLHQTYEQTGPKKGEPLILVHGWPDSPRTWDKVLPAFHQAGYQTIVPYLGGYGPSSFRDPLVGRKPRRTGQPVAFAQDIIHLADRLDIKRFHFVGHDWGARMGYALAALFPKRLKSLTAVSVPFEPGKASPPFPQAQAFWYQWLLCTRPGEKKFREDPIAFGQAQGTSGVPSDGTSKVNWMRPPRVGKARISKMLCSMAIAPIGDTRIKIRSMPTFSLVLTPQRRLELQPFCYMAARITVS